MFPFLLLCWIHEQRERRFNSKDFMSDQTKIENEKLTIQSTGEKQTYANEMKRRRHNLGTESCLVER